MHKPVLSVLIPTYKRAHLLKHALEGLTKQTFTDFEVVIVIKPSGDGTEALVEKYMDQLDIRQVTQTYGYVVDALNLGFKNARGKIIVFLDDDAYPFPDFLQKHLEMYNQINVGGVSGNVIPAKLNENCVKPINGELSEIIPRNKPFLDSVRRKVWAKPLGGLEDCLIYISKSGVVEYNYNVARFASSHAVPSLLGMGCNISILAKAVLGFRFPAGSILGLSWEQLLGWNLWKRGYRLIFNPNAKVYHIHRGQTLSRNIREKRKDTLRWVENNLLFYRLYGFEPDLSVLSRLFWLVFETFVDVKKICINKDLHRFARLKSKFYSECIGLNWLLARRKGCKYNLLLDLEKFL